MLMGIATAMVAISGQAIADGHRTPMSERTPLGYATLEGGVSIVPDRDITYFSVPSTIENNVGFTVGGEIGSQASEHFRFGLSLLYNRFKTSSTHVGESYRRGGQVVDLVRPLWNVYWDFSLMDELLRPYVGVGLGAAYGLFDSTTLTYGSTSDWGYAFAFYLGTHVSLNDSWMLKVGYRFNRTGSLWNDQDSFLTGNLCSHDFVLGVTTLF
jgi:opacity protein-like surface antigen